MEDVARDLTIRSIDGFALNATVYDPGVRTESVVIINAATAVPRSFYKDYACHLKESVHTGLIHLQFIGPATSTGG